MLYEIVGECEQEAKQYLENVYERDSSDFCYKSVVADWNYSTNLTSEEAEQAAAAAAIAYANFQFKAWDETIRHWDYEAFTDAVIKRQLKFLNIVGVAALSNADLGRVKGKQILLLVTCFQT